MVHYTKGSAEKYERIKCAVELVEGDQPEHFGTAFCILMDNKHCYYVTCGHVIQKVAKEAKGKSYPELKGIVIQLGGKPAKVAYTGGPDVDLVVLSIARDEIPRHPLAVLAKPSQGTPFTAYGFRESGSTPQIHPVSGKVGRRTFLGRAEKVDQFILTSDREQFKEGMSGGPVLDLQANGLAMLTKLEPGQEQVGFALELASTLKRVAPKLPIVLADPQTSFASFRAQYGAKASLQVPHLMPYQADRIAPKGQLQKVLDDHDSPLIIAIVPGPASAEHDMFLHVFGYENLKLPESNRLVLQWQYTTNDYHRVMEEKLLGEQVQFQTGQIPELTEMVKHLPPGNILIAVDSGGSKFTKQDLEALMGWLSCWQALSLETTRTIVIGIAVRFHDVEGSWRERIWSRFLNKHILLRVRQSLGALDGIHWIGELEDIPRGMLNGWQDKTEQWLETHFEDYQRGDLRERLDKPYEKRKTFKMRELAPKLRAIMRDYLKNLRPK